jgi:catechol 2,3-dioxygenase-like lactoylglutathione lyase family enzyme
MEKSIAFYTKALDFECVEHGGDGDPSFSGGNIYETATLG